VVKEKGTKALTLFNQLLAVNSSDQMAQLQLIRLSRLMDKTT